MSMTSEVSGSLIGSNVFNSCKISNMMSRFSIIICVLLFFLFLITVDKSPFKTSSTQVYPAKIAHNLLYSPSLFGKKLFSVQDRLVNNKQTHLLEQNFTETIIPIDKSCMLLFNL